MTMLIVAALAFLVIHLLVSGTAVRGAVVRTIGEGPYMGLFSLASLAIIVWLSIAYGQARGDGAVFWGAAVGARHATVAFMLIALLFVVPGLATPNPTSVKQEGALDRPNAVQGMLRITRHPFLWGVAIWAAGHLLVNGDTPSLILFGTMLFLALVGTTMIDAKRKKALGPQWDSFVAQTSNIPFAAILGGRQTLSIREIGWWRIALAVGVWLALIFLHPLLFGVSPIG